MCYIKCKLSNLILVEECYRNVYHNQKVVIKQAQVLEKITTMFFRRVTIYLESQWLQTLIHVTEDQILNFVRRQQIKIIFSIRIKWSFFLTLMSFLNGFEEV